MVFDNVSIMSCALDNSQDKPKKPTPTLQVNTSNSLFENDDVNASKTKKNER